MSSSSSPRFAAVADGGAVIDPKVVEGLVAENARGDELAAQAADAA